MRFDGETGRMREAKREISTSAAHEGGLASEAGDVEEALNPANQTGNDRGDEKTAEAIAFKIPW